MTEGTLLTGAYWIVDLLGDASQLSGDFRFEFPDDQVLDWMESSPASLELYSRPSNADNEAWTLVTTASVADASAERVRFDGVSLGDVQLAIAVPAPSVTMMAGAGCLLLSIAGGQRQRRRDSGRVGHTPPARGS